MASVTSPPVRPTHPSRRSSMSRRDRWVLGGLLVSTLVPSAAGAFRVVTLAAGVEARPDNLRFVDQPWPVILHVLSVVPYSMLGAFQVVPGFRRRHPRFHRRVGWATIPLAATVAGSGIWMTLGYDLPAVDGERFGALGLLRLGVGVGMLASLALALAVAAIRRRDWLRHGAWMLRCYALAMGAAAQVFTVGATQALTDLSADQKAAAMGAGWVISLAIAERAIRRSH